MRAYRTTGSDGGIALADVPEPSVRYSEALVDVHATSLNYRDLLNISDQAPFVPLSDGAGVVSAVGDGVTDVRVGDRVVIAFMPSWLDGPLDASKQSSALGAPGCDGVLREWISVPAKALVRLPDEMSFIDASALPCAAVTAWAALFERRALLPGETLLLFGTGGVSMFALNFAKKAGARVIITSSSDEKLQKALALGADETINYRTTPHWADRVIALTDGRGADLAIDVGGPATLNQTLDAVRYDGRISLMGVLTGFDGPVSTGTLLRKRITLQGIYVGPTPMLNDVVRARPKPVIDHVYAFEEAPKAFETLSLAKHVGKLVIQMPASSGRA